MGVNITRLKHDDFWQRRRSIREGIVIAIVVAFSTAVFFGVARVMSTRGSSLPTAVTQPAAQPDDDYDDAATTSKPDSPQPE